MYRINISVWVLARVNACMLERLLIRSNIHQNRKCFENWKIATTRERTEHFNLMLFSLAILWMSDENFAYSFSLSLSRILCVHSTRNSQPIHTAFPSKWIHKLCVCVLCIACISFVNWTESWWAISSLDIIVYRLPSSPLIFWWNSRLFISDEDADDGDDDDDEAKWAHSIKHRVLRQQRPIYTYTAHNINSIWNFRRAKVTKQRQKYRCDEPRIRKKMRSNGETKLKQQHQHQHRQWFLCDGNGNNSTKRIKWDEDYETHTKRTEREKKVEKK